MKKNSLIVLGLFLSFSLSAQKKPNILFIAVDDLRPELGCYGSPIAKTPNFDRLAASGLLFNRAYCQQAICSPSRASIMTGAKPETIHVIENFSYFRDLNPDIITIPQQLKVNGYETVFSGKIFHPGYTDDEKSWSRKEAKVTFSSSLPKLIGGYASPENQAIFIQNKKEIEASNSEDGKYGLGRGPAYESYEVPDQTYPDGQNTDIAIATLKELVQNPDKPFFLGLGFKLPHLDWIAPKKYWDLYEREKIPLAAYDYPPKDGAAVGLHASFELRARSGIPKYEHIDTELARTLKHAYLASVSYVDAQLGRMLDALEASGQKDNTIIVLWSDHGWHLGDMGVWGKATNYEIGTRVPFIISTPKMPQYLRGQKTDAIVELLDIFPTLCDLTDTPKPSHLEGKSLVPLLEKTNVKWTESAFSQFPSPALREWAANPLSEGMRKTYFGPLMADLEKKIEAQEKEKWDRDLFENYLMGYTIRTDRYRFIAWKDSRNPAKPPVNMELYDHKKDPNETVNVAATHKRTCKKLLSKIKKEYKH